MTNGAISDTLVVHSRAIGDAMEAQCLAANLRRYARVRGDMDGLRLARAIEQASKQLTQHLETNGRAA